MTEKLSMAARDAVLGPLLEAGWEMDPARDAIRQKAEGHRAMQAALTSLDGRVVPIALDEWNYWHRDYLYGELGCVYDLADGLGLAVGLHELFRQIAAVDIEVHSESKSTTSSGADRVEIFAHILFHQMILVG